MCDLARALAEHRGPGYVVAPAGFGKTHLIAEATALSDGRQLILTHTYAGVNAIRRKLRTLGVKEQQFHVDTIASWALHLCLSYRHTSGWAIERPADNEQWNALYAAVGDFLDHEFVRRIIRSSYVGLYVDEYQDCSVSQHAIVMKISRDLPCRVLGDPLQGIFDFGGQQPVDWARDIEGVFAQVGQLDVPHRWAQAGAGQLGEWLRNVRTNLENGTEIDLRRRLPEGVRYVGARNVPQDLLRTQVNTCRYFNCGPKHTVIAIHKGSQDFKARCHRLSQNLSGRYSSIEEVEGRDMFAFFRRMTAADSNSRRLQEAIAFAGKCMTHVNANLPAGTIRGEAVTIRAATRSPEVAKIANEYLSSPNSAGLAELLKAIKGLAQTNVTRADLLNRVLGVLQKHTMHPELSCDEAVEQYQREFRFKGRPVGHLRQIGTTLLVKGLEYDHAIVLDATTLSRKELYVALTRGARTLTIVSTNPVLNPPA
ncbi:UvrD-helicase domain-containing protein [Paracoccus sp. MBLB3053]|uniref:UvrD-helicase domain-containing protein n=1 Tax=Paracoccus aurantius TaxID=3073814 RepID=A0ABU2HT53_9RHOB|nr:UvrD-helicase domain-containing protein [Paracoccus sp. MBLB3053]MDS9468228.1 UvrD-helicase domain-containing protein [Paracoccus sp. MBLB3053]